MTFSDTAWTAIAPIRSAIDELPFVTELLDGSLDKARFDYYMGQDALYLFDFGRALAGCALQSRTSDDLVFWSKAAMDTIVVERALHETHVPDHVDLEKSPTCAAYTGYLTSLVQAGSYAELVAGVLPCFWIYKDVGDAMLAKAGDLENHAYGDWIGTYADDEFAESTRQAIAIMDRLADEATPATRERMLEAFRRASQFEWMFWDAAHRQETWPVG
ncbi:MAG: TenA family protein [Mobilicoccus sp.]|nr:TenA family protein [Mobilicoccus sp.]